MRGNVRPVCHGKLAAGGHNTVSLDYHGAVVQRGILEENVHYQASVNLGLKAVSRGHNLVQGRFLLDHNEGAGMLRRHGADGFREFHHRAGAHPFLLDAQQPVEQVPGAFGQARIDGQPVEHMPDFRLEQDDDGQYAHIQEGIEQHRHHAHVKRAHNGLQHQQDHQHQHDIEHGGVSPDAPDEEIDDGGHHQDVQHIGPPEAEESEYAQQLYHGLQR